MDDSNPCSKSRDFFWKKFSWPTKKNWKYFQEEFQNFFQNNVFWNGFFNINYEKQGFSIVFSEFPIFSDIFSINGRFPSKNSTELIFWRRLRKVSELFLKNKNSKRLSHQSLESKKNNYFVNKSFEWWKTWESNFLIGDFTNSKKN